MSVEFLDKLDAHKVALEEAVTAVANHERNF